MSDNATPIQGKVARILNSRELALNIGARQGVEVGMKFDVLDRKAEGIRDPDTREELGSVIRPKIRVKVILVEDRLSIASTYRTRLVNVGGRGSLALSDLFMPERTVQKVETLKADDQMAEELDEAHSFVKVGDPVQQVLATEEASK